MPPHAHLADSGRLGTFTMRVAGGAPPTLTMWLGILAVWAASPAAAPLRVPGQVAPPLMWSASIQGDGQSCPHQNGSSNSANSKIQFSYFLNLIACRD